MNDALLEFVVPFLTDTFKDYIEIKDNNIDVSLVLHPITPGACCFCLIHVE
jgi:hypothetical protein